MKITYILTSADSAAGTERAVIGQANQAAKSGHDVEILSVYRTSDVPAFDISSAVVVSYLVDATGWDLSQGLGAAAVGEFGPSLLVPQRWDDQFCQATDDALTAYFETCAADCIVSTTPALAALTVRFAPKTVIVIHEEHRATMARSKDSFEPLALYGRELDCLVSLTAAGAEFLAAYFGEDAPLLPVVPNAVSNDFHPRSLLTERRVVSAGRFVSGKDFESLIRAFASAVSDCPGWSLRIYGSGPQAQSMRKVARSNGVENAVEIVPPAADMYAEWTKGSIFAMSSRSEGLPMVALEAAAAGLPLVAVDCDTGPREIIDDGVNGILVPPDDAAALGLALERLMKSSELREEMSHATHRIVERFSVPRVTAMWKALFSQLRELQNGCSSRLGRAQERSRLARSHQPGSVNATGGSPGPHDDRGGETFVAEMADELLTPESQSKRACAKAQQILANAGVEFVWVPTQDAVRQRFAVPGTARREVRAALTETVGEGYCLVPMRGSTALRRYPLEFGELAVDDVLVADANVVRVERAETDWSGAIHGRHAQCDIEFWDLGPDGNLIPPRANSIVDQVEPADFDKTVSVQTLGGCVPTLPLGAKPDWRQPDFPIDAVFTWVDDTDEVWKSARAAVAGNGADGRHAESDSDARFLNRNELKYALRSLHAYAPWVNHIYVVSAGQRPDWLNTKHDAITFVDHEDIFTDQTALPTFNSHAIESQLHHIDGLSEHFLYFNDDTMLRQYVKPDRFFLGNGTLLFYPSPTKINDLTHDVPPHLAAGMRTRALLEDRFGLTVTQGLLHTPYPQRRSVLYELEESYPEEWERTMRARFRGDGDLSTVSSLAPYFAYATGRAVPSTMRVAYVGLGADDLDQRMRDVVRGRHDLFALGEPHEGVDDSDAVSFAVQNFLEEVLPIPAPWERARPGKG